MDNEPILTAYAKLVCPFGLITFNVFLAIFEGIMNCYAELSNFGDRLFYEDFWNSTNFDEFSRRWNRPVHEFLKNHIYNSIESIGFSKFQSYLGTLIFSAIFHELVMVFYGSFYQKK